jgi:hypothetical protein
MIINSESSPQEKQKIWRKKQIEIFYGSGRPVFTITENNQFIRKNYDCEYYIRTNQFKYLENKNFVDRREYTKKYRGI